MRGQVEAVLKILSILPRTKAARRRLNSADIGGRPLRKVGWRKAVELVKLARKDGEGFDRATWLHKAKELPKEGFKGEVERHLKGNETEAW